MSFALAIVVLAAMGALIVYWFWPGSAKCKDCKSELNTWGYCTEPTCTFSTRQQTYKPEKRRV
jgi:hypothetical protein